MSRRLASTSITSPDVPRCRPARRRLLLSLAGNHSVVVVEHDIDFVRSIATRVSVLHEGHVIAEGDLDTVQNDPQVVEVYLGV